MNRCSASYAIMESWIKTALGHHCILGEWPKSTTLTKPGAGQDVEQQTLSFITGGNSKGCGHFGRQFGSFLHCQTYSNCMIHQSALLNIYPNDLKAYVRRKTCTWMFIAASFTAAKNLATNTSYICRMEYYSALKRSELLSHEKTLSNLKCILLSGRSQSEKATYILYDSVILKEVKLWRQKMNCF